ncbi:hypothetical protein ACFL4L_06355 [bacterium]
MIFAIVLLYGCTGRNRNNPLDPQNPETEGKVQGLDIVSEYNRVSLKWKSLSSDYAVHYQIYRKQIEQIEYQHIGLTGVPSFQDSGLILGAPVHYRVSALTGTQYESPLSDSVTITPGPHDYWVADYYGERIVRLTYDAQHILDDIQGFYLPVDIAVDTTTEEIWALNRRDGELLKLVHGQIEDRIGGFHNPRLLTLDPYNQMIWIVQDSLREIVRVDYHGRLIDKLRGFGRITDISWAGLNLGCWVVDADSNSVDLISPDKKWTLHTDFENPLGVDAHQQDGWAWIADHSQLYQAKLNGEFNSKYHVENGEIISLSLDHTNSNCWIVIRTDEDSEYHIQKINVHGELLCSQSGFGEVFEILANPFDGGCIIADYLWGQIVRLSAEGEIISRYQGFISPIGLSIG